MALKLEDVAKPENILLGVALYVGWNYALPVAAAAARPVVKAGLTGWEWIMASAAGARETMNDMAAEAAAEMDNHPPKHETVPEGISTPPRRKEPVPG
jgi:hypothetical protein